jgi:hypothetical protein
MQYPVVFLPAGHFSFAVLYRGLEVENNQNYSLSENHLGKAAGRGSYFFVLPRQITHPKVFSKSLFSHSCASKKRQHEKYGNENKRFFTGPSFRKADTRMKCNRRMMIQSLAGYGGIKKFLRLYD